MDTLFQRKLKQEKLDLIKNGFSAYVESATLVRLLTRDLKLLNLDVDIENTELGCWFIPNRAAE
ncbi:hypothetical protein [Metabacillus fastidiosus]|uniref:Uncharacterized protein n=1 Tax=Metabacillus fastidiosus TaxID=1458 RepID=A0ABU6NWU3_9BACI|nr:hypothetical protein [Metabacillus fastidiosus]MED4401193.1 hypothetical protein [Metabacillus fastidiosus]MED4453229.1 hypothetical protein [Metabacillus fastidiosus]MED4464120.1 hypothetical protein [Metabacillus fastidiosus]MED4531003.1 hypothetical protein [Metabacillus fastidiosus]